MILLKLIAILFFGFVLLVSFSNSLDCYPEEPKKVMRNLALAFVSLGALIGVWKLS